MAGELAIGRLEMSPDFVISNATVREAMLVGCGDALVRTPVAIVTLHIAEAATIISPELEAFNTIMAPQVPPPLDWDDAY